MQLKYLSFIFASTILIIQAEAALAQFDPNFINQTPTENPNSISNPNIPSNSYPSSLPLGDINQQGRIINNNNGTSGQQINCGRACIYFYTDFSKNDARFGAGINIPLFTPENELTTAQSKKLSMT
jgi:hypothetical protein